MTDKLTQAEIEELAKKLIVNATSETVLTNRFYGVLATNVENKFSYNFPTAATNGKIHYWNPTFAAQLSPKQAKTVKRHELEHDARHHSTRRGGRDPKRWNVACDHAINVDLIDEGGEFPAVIDGQPWKPYADPKYRGWSAEEIYRAMELDEAKAKQEEEERKQQQQQQAAGDTADDEAGEGAGNEEPSDEEPEESDADAEGDAEGTDGDDEEAGEGAGNEDDDTDGDEEGDADAEGDAEGDADEDGEEEDGDGEGTDDGEEPGEGDEPTSSNDEPSRNCGEVLDAPEGEAGSQDQKWSTIVRQAAAMAKAEAASGRGTMPGHVDREIQRDQAPRQDWRETLRAYFDQGAERRETWNRPNRRFIGSGTILPGSERDGLNTVCWLIDTSGSVDDKALAAVATEAQAALDEGIIDKLIVIDGDTQVNSVAEYVAGDQIEFKFKGRGGTIMKPLFDYVKENVDNPSLIICATDGFIESERELGDEPQCTVLWAYHGYPDAVKRFMAKTPWNAPSMDIGWH